VLEFSNQKELPQNNGNTLSVALQMSRFQQIAAGAVKRTALRFFEIAFCEAVSCVIKNEVRFSKPLKDFQRKGVLDS